VTGQGSHHDVRTTATATRTPGREPPSGDMVAPGSTGFGALPVAVPVPGLAVATVVTRGRGAKQAGADAQAASEDAMTSAAAAEEANELVAQAGRLIDEGSDSPGVGSSVRRARPGRADGSRQGPDGVNGGWA